MEITNGCVSCHVQAIAREAVARTIQQRSAASLERLAELQAASDAEAQVRFAASPVASSDICRVVSGHHVHFMFMAIGAIKLVLWATSHILAAALSQMTGCE